MITYVHMALLSTVLCFTSIWLSADIMHYNKSVYLSIVPLLYWPSLWNDLQIYFEALLLYMIETMNNEAMIK